MTVARAFWTIAPGRGEIRSGSPAEPLPRHVLVRTLASGVSRGTEALVFAGRVPPSQYQAMRAPFMDGEFPFPVKYGYSAVGRTTDGARVFVLHPHQDIFLRPPRCASPCPTTCPRIARCLPPTWRRHSTRSGMPRRLPASACW